MTRYLSQRGRRLPGVNADSIAFRLSSPSLDAPVAVRLRTDGGRWIAVAEIGRGVNVGLAPTARGALEAVLAALPAPVVRALMADVTLFGVSADLARRATRTG